MDLVARRGGAPVSRFQQADEIVLTIRGSKVDQYNRGEVRNHFASQDEWGLCAVRAAAWAERWCPERFTGSESMEPLLMWSNGTPVKRGDVQSILRRAAVAMGVDPQHIGTHSLRFGGASALWAAYRDVGLIQRWGRWISNTFHSYIWEPRRASEGVAAAMARADLALV